MFIGDTNPLIFDIFQIGGVKFTKSIYEFNDEWYEIHKLNFTVTEREAELLNFTPNLLNITKFFFPCRNCFY